MHPTVAAVYPMDVHDALERGHLTPGQFDWVFLDDSVSLSDAEKSFVRSIARHALVVASSQEWTVTATQPNLRITPASARSRHTATPAEGHLAAGAVDVNDPGYGVASRRVAAYLRPPAASSSSVLATKCARGNLQPLAASRLATTPLGAPARYKSSSKVRQVFLRLSATT